MTTYLVCPIDGTLPADNGTNSTPANNAVPTVSDAVGAGSAIIGSASATTLNVTTGANFPVGTWFTIPTRNEKFYVSGQNANALTVVRAAENVGGGPVQTFTPSAAIAQNDVILTGLDVNGKPPHCPVCGTAALTVDPAHVTALTGVASGSQHPADVDATYVTNGSAAEEQPGATAYTLTGTAAVYPHTFKNAAGVVNRGTSTVTAETINATVGP